jgi:hypothetical protein
MSTKVSTKIKLGQRPTTFKPIPVKFFMPDGTEGIITATYAYKTRTDYSKFLNKVFEANGEEKPEDESKIDFVALAQKNGEKTAEQLLEAIKEWDQEFDLNKENLMTLADELPAAVGALFSSFADACNKGYLGN